MNRFLVVQSGHSEFLGGVGTQLEGPAVFVLNLVNRAQSVAG